MALSSLKGFICCVLRKRIGGNFWGKTKESCHLQRTRHNRETQGKKDTETDRRCRHEIERERETNDDASPRTATATTTTTTDWTCDGASRAGVSSLSTSGTATATRAATAAKTRGEERKWLAVGVSSRISTASAAATTAYDASAWSWSLPQTRLTASPAISSAATTATTDGWTNETSRSDNDEWSHTGPSSTWTICVRPWTLYAGSSLNSRWVSVNCGHGFASNVRSNSRLSGTGHGKNRPWAE